MRTLMLTALAAATLTACADQPARLPVGLQTSEMTVRTALRSVLLGEVRLPEYANAPEVARQTETGLIEVIPGVIWADTPREAMGNALVRNLAAITGRPVAAAPWPLEDPPQAELSVRVERMLVVPGNVLEMSGQYALRRPDEGPERLRRFDIAVPVTGPDLPALSEAHGRAWRQLAEEIAQGLQG